MSYFSILSYDETRHSGLIAVCYLSDKIFGFEVPL